MKPTMTVILGDITQLSVDAIVNAANTTLLGGGGVDGAIHRVAGQALLEACRQLGGCATGDAKITHGYRLPARYVIHTVGPVYHDGLHGEADKLVSCYVHSLELATRHHCTSIAFPCVSTGAYRYPAEAAARLAIQTVGHWLESHGSPFPVTFCCFLERDRALYAHLLQQM